MNTTITAQDVLNADKSLVSQKRVGDYYLTIQGWGDCSSTFYNKRGEGCQPDQASIVVLRTCAGGFKTSDDQGVGDNIAEISL